MFSELKQGIEQREDKIHIISDIASVLKLAKFVHHTRLE